MKTKTQATQEQGQGPAVPAAQQPLGVAPAQRAKREKHPDVVAAEAALAKAKAEAKAARAATSKPKPEPRPTCTATKHNGEACTAKAKQGQVTCVDHTPAWERLTAEEQAEWREECAVTGPEQWANRLGWHAVKASIGAGGNRTGGVK